MQSASRANKLLWNDVMQGALRLRCGGLLALSACIAASAAAGQAVRASERHRPSLVAPGGSLTVSASPSYVRFYLSAREAAFGDNPVQIITSYSNTGTFRSNIDLYGYFANAQAALEGSQGAAAIPSSAVLGQMPSGLHRQFVPFVQASPVGGVGASLKLFTWPMHKVISDSNQRVDALNLEIDLRNLPNLPADTYTGILILQAQAF